LKNSSMYITVFLLFCVVSVQSCSVLIYPERDGKTIGKVNSKVLKLNDMALVLYLIPGTIAFAADLSTGAIYLPAKGTKNAPASNKNGVPKAGVVLYLARENRTAKGINDAIAMHTGIEDVLQHPSIHVSAIRRPNSSDSALISDIGNYLWK